MSFAVPHPDHPNLRVLQHPLAEQALKTVRTADVRQEAFADAMNRLSLLLSVEITAGLATREVEVATPLEATDVREVSANPVLVPILRAGLALLPGFSKLLGDHTVCHIGLVRNEETLQPEAYLNKLTDLSGAEKVTLVLDPMLATGGSAAWAIQACKDKGAADIRFCCVLAAPEGVRKLAGAHPDVPVITAALDRQLNDKGYILPGLGDAGDRYFGT